MSRFEDPVDKALHSLSGKSSPEGDPDGVIRKRVMNGYEANKPLPIMSRHGTLLIVLALVAVSCFGFAAVGGVEIIRGLFITVTVNGTEVEPEDVREDEEGNIHFTVPIDSSSEEIEFGMSLESGEYEGKKIEGKGGMVSINAEIEAEGDKANVKMKIENPEEE